MCVAGLLSSCNYIASYIYIFFFLLVNQVVLFVHTAGPVTVGIPTFNSSNEVSSAYNVMWCMLCGGACVRT